MTVTRHNRVGPVRRKPVHCETPVIGNEDIPGSVDGHGSHEENERPEIQRSRDNPLGRNLADAAVAFIPDIKIAGAIEGEPGRTTELSGSSESAIARRAGQARTGECGDGSVRAHLPDPVRGVLGDIEVTCGIDGDALQKADTHVSN